jgi:hypothetical protein
MTSIHIVTGSIRQVPDALDVPDFPPERRLGVIRDAASKMFYFTMIAIVFAFVLILTIGTPL